MGLTDLLQTDFIKLEMEGTTKEEAIRELSSLLMNKGVLLNEKVFIQAVLTREAECTTGIGMGVAIPHGKSDGVKQTSLCFGRSISGIEYDSLDGESVQLMFLIAVPADSDDEHLRILSQISRKIMHQDVREQLLLAETTEAIYAALS